MDYAIIAAGEGSRLAREGVKRPKPLVELKSTPLIDRLIQIFLKNNAQSLSIIVNEEMTEVRQHLEDLKLTIPFNLVVKSTPSSMHSFYELSKYLTNPKFCMTTVDTIFREEEFSAFIQQFEKSENLDGMMAVTDYIDDEKPLYISVNDSMQITGFLDKPENQEKYISGGIYGLTQKAIPTLNKCIENNISRMRNFQRELITDELYLKAYPFSKILDVDHQEDIEKAEAFLSE